MSAAAGRDDLPGAARYGRMFARCAERGEGAFVPFTVLGDPDPATSLEIVRTLASSGADALELGIPFSDPVADGPAIQAADLRALGAGTRVADAWRILAAVRAAHPELPIGLLVYANLVLHRGAASFYAAAARAGVDSVLVADAPLLESAPLERAAVEHGIAPVLVAAPNVTYEGLRAIAERSRGYVYVVSRPGVTGVQSAGLRDDAASVLRRLRGDAPPLLGFGIGSPDDVRHALALGAAGAIAGSAVATRIERHRAGPQEVLLATLAEFVGDLKAATRPTR